MITVFDGPKIYFKLLYQTFYLPIITIIFQAVNASRSFCKIAHKFKKKPKNREASQNNRAIEFLHQTTPSFLLLKTHFHLVWNGIWSEILMMSSIDGMVIISDLYSSHVFIDLHWLLSIFSTLFLVWSPYCGNDFFDFIIWAPAMICFGGAPCTTN